MALDGPVLQARVLDGVHAWRATLPETLRAPLDEMLIRKRYLLVDDMPDYFGPRATPLLSLPGWVALAEREAGRPVDDEVVAVAAEAAVTGYYLIRVQDDHLDEGTGESGVVVMLAAALQGRMTSLFGRVVPAGAPFWALLDEVFVTCADAMLRERALLGGPGIRDEATFLSLLGRYDPLLLPGAAVAAVVGDAAMVEALRPIVRHLGSSVQRFNDAIDATTDLAAGRRTWAVCRTGETPDALLGGLLAGGMDTLVAEAVAEAQEVGRLAAAAGLPGAVARMHARAAELDAVRLRWLEDALEALFDG